MSRQGIRIAYACIWREAESRGCTLTLRVEIQFEFSDITQMKGTQTYRSYQPPGLRLLGLRIAKCLGENPIELGK